MTFLPIVDRELRITARRRGTYWMRFAIAAAVIGIWFLLSISGGHSLSAARKARVIFGAISIIGLGFSLLAGVFLTADCLSEEKRDGTLGLLFLTDLKGYDVVFGKLVSTSIHAFYGLLTILPLLALPMLMGGVTAGDFWRVTLVLITTLFFSLSIGLLISAFNRETRQVMTTTLLVLLTLTAVLPVLWWAQKISLNSSLFDALLWPSPAYAYRCAADACYRTRFGPHEFWTSLLVIGGLAIAALVLASIVLPRSWQEKSSSTNPSGKISWRRRFRFGSAKFRKSRRRLLDQNPFYWLATRDRLLTLMTLPFFSVLLPIWVCFFLGSCFSRSGRGSGREVLFSMTMFMAYGLHQMVKYLIAIEATRRLSEDKQSGALEVLLVTPLGLRQILLGQRRALGVFFRNSVLAIILVNLGLIWLFVVPNPLGIRAGDAWPFYELFVGGIIMAAMDCYALGWVGMWMALAKQRHHRAVLATLGRVMLVPWAAVLFFVFLGMSGRGMSEDEVGVLFGCWFVLGFLNDIVVAQWAKSNLHRLFRLASPQWTGTPRGLTVQPATLTPPVRE